MRNTANDFDFKWQLHRGIEAEFENRFARFCSASGCVPYLYSLTLQFEQGLIRTVKRPERWDLVNELSLEVFKRINSNLVPDPHASRNQKLRLGFLTFTENRNRENLDLTVSEAASTNLIHNSLILIHRLTSAEKKFCLFAI